MPTVDEVAALTGRSQRTVRRLARSGVFLGAIRRPTRNGGWLIPTASVQHFLAQHPTPKDTE